MIDVVPVVGANGVANITYGYSLSSHHEAGSATEREYASDSCKVSVRLHGRTYMHATISADLHACLP